MRDGTCYGNTTQSRSPAAAADTDHRPTLEHFIGSIDNSQRITGISCAAPVRSECTAALQHWCALRTAPTTLAARGGSCWSGLIGCVESGTAGRSAEGVSNWAYPFTLALMVRTNSPVSLFSGPRGLCSRTERLALRDYAKTRGDNFTRPVSRAPFSSCACHRAMGNRSPAVVLSNPQVGGQPCAHIARVRP